MFRRLQILLITVAEILVVAGCASTVAMQRDALLLQVRQHNAPIGIVARMQNLQPLQTEDFVMLHNSGVPEAVMKEYIHLTAASYVLDMSTIERLRAQGLSREFVDFLLATPQLYPQVEVKFAPSPYPVYYPIFVERKR